MLSNGMLGVVSGWKGICVMAAFRVALANGAALAEEPIGLFDLRYTLKIDLRAPAQVRTAWDHCHAAATLQGIVNRNAPNLYLLFVDSQVLPGRNVDEYWMDKFRRPGGWLGKRKHVIHKDIVELIERYRPFIHGAVVYDTDVPSTSNVASTVAGAENLVAVRYDPSPESLYHRLVLEGPRLPVRVWLIRPDGRPKFTGSGDIPDIQRPSTGSAKCDAYVWMKHRYVDAGRCDAAYGAYYIDAHWLRKPGASVLNHHTLTNHDFFVSRRAFFFDLSPWSDEPATDDPDQKPGTDYEVLKELLLSAYRQTEGDRIIHIGGFPPWAFKYTQRAGGKHGGVPTEWEYTRIISAYNAFQDADAIGYGAMANASFWAHFPLKTSYSQKWVTRRQLVERGYLTEDDRVQVDGRQFVVLYVGDYDAASWVYQRVIDIWDHPDRGRVPLMWCISPVLDRRVPMAMHYMRSTATANDYFAAADNGAGYLNPGMLQEPRGVSGLPGGLEAWADHCSAYYAKWGVTITGFVIDGYAPGLDEAGLDCYAKFSPNGIVPQKVPMTLLHGNMPVLRAGWDVNHDDPAEAARVILERIKLRSIPFHWFRNILKSPSWYVQVHDKLHAADAKVELLDAPTFFELYRTYLKNHPQAARGLW
ncbi:MAG: hypothetical protein JSV19_11695 [Phycisphaerales bacterium]|nr:MAG: hypothetical protein JSV19_11695 [Phycisphaerales bacterium]